MGLYDWDVRKRELAERIAVAIVDNISKVRTLKAGWKRTSPQERMAVEAVFVGLIKREIEK